MKHNLRNMTITVEEDVARWARLEAARKDTSVSRLVGEMLKGQMQDSDEYEKSMRSYISRKPFLKTDGKYLTRDQAHDRDRLR